MNMRNNFRPIDRQTLILRLNSLRGLFAVMIVIGHCSMHFEREPLPLWIIHKFNMVSVCFFFFVSGMSLSQNVERRKDYFTGFIKNKVFLLILFALVAELVGRGLEFVILNQKFSFDLGIVTNWNWYIYEMSVLYLIFYLVYKYIRQDSFRELILWVAALGICVVTLVCCRYGNWKGWTGAYYFSTFSFPLGVSVYAHYDRVQNRLNKKPIVSGMVLLILAFCSCICLIMPNDSIIGGIFLRNIMGICVMLDLFLLLNMIDVARISIISKVIQVLTRLSTEIYLYQFCLLTIWADVYERMGRNIDVLYVVAVVSSTIILAYVTNFVDTGITKVVKAV